MHDPYNRDKIKSIAYTLGLMKYALVLLCISCADFLVNFSNLTDIDILLT